MSLAYTIPPLKEMQKMSVGDEGKDKEVNGAMVEFGKEMRKLFLLEEGYNNLNHGMYRYLKTKFVWGG